MIGALFGGEVPRPANGRSWKQHAYEFDAGQWRELIRVQTGRLLLCMSSNCTTSCPSYFGVPPPCPSDSPLFTIRVPYFGLRFPAHLEHLTGARPTSYGVFDVTDFAEHHPGGRELLADAVLDSDCTERFDRAAHTERARQVLLAQARGARPCGGADTAPVGAAAAELARAAHRMGAHRPQARARASPSHVGHHRSTRGGSAWGRALS